MKSPGDGLIGLVENNWPDAVASLLSARPELAKANPKATEAYELAKLANRVLTLDAEDFGELAKEWPNAKWRQKLIDCSFPATPKDPRRGALGSVVSLFELMLEVLQIRAERKENQELVVIVHLMSEYLCHLAWESVLGHGGDPLQMANCTGQKFGTNDPECPMSSAERATCRRSLHACSGDQNGYVAYLDKFHSRLGDAMAICAMNHQTTEAGERPDVGTTCPNPCNWVLEIGDLEVRRDLDGRLRLAKIFVDSPLIALRHHAPVGHFFGVPSVKEIRESWQKTWHRLSAEWNDGENPLTGKVPEANGEALPGLSLLLSVVAGREIKIGTLLHEIEADLIDALRNSGI